MFKKLLLRTVYTIIILLAIVGTYHIYNIGTHSKAKSIALSLEIEKDIFKSYINKEITYNKRFFTDGYSIDFQLFNRSRYTTYSNFKFEVSYLSETGVVIDREIITIYKEISPNEYIEVNEKTSKSPEKSKELSINLLKVDIIQ